MRPQCCVHSDIADWLALVHLERYQGAFRQNGYVRVRDVLSLGRDDLQQLGITATGHRKRLLNLVQRTQGLVAGRSGEMAGDVCRGPGRSPCCLDGPKAEEKSSVGTKDDISREAFPGPGPNSDVDEQSRHPAPSMEAAALPAKPVPKPRTVFPLTHRAASPEHTAGLPPHASPPVRGPAPFSEQPPGRPPILEGPDPGGSSTVAEGLPAPAGRLAGPAELPARSAPPAQSRPREDGSGSALLASPPADRARSAATGADRTPLPSAPLGFTSESPPAAAGATASAAAALQGRRKPSLPLPAVGESASPRSRRETVPDASAPSPVPAQSVEGAEVPRSRPLPHPSGLPVQNGSVAAENHGSLEQLRLGLPLTPQGLGNGSGPAEESISPYCESVFGRFWSAREPAAASLEGQEYEEVPEFVRGQEGAEGASRGAGAEGKGPAAPRGAALASRPTENEAEGYSTVEAPRPSGSPPGLPGPPRPDEAPDDLTISPYASYASPSEWPTPVLSGWLDKLSPQGNYVFQRRFVKFDGKKLMYFHHEKDPYPRGVVPLSVIDAVRSTKDNKFQVVTRHRIFVFRAESEAQRRDWCSALQQTVAQQQLRCPWPGASSSAHFQKSGFLELKGYKSRLFAVLSLAEMWLYKSEQAFKMGIAICLIQMHGSTVREAKGRSFELITPLKMFSFGAESEREKREWMEVLQDAIAETLYDYEVAEKVWSNKANRFCADCGALSPDWASVSLCVVICRQCAGQHRGLGTSVSKVQSLKLDTSIWSNEMVQLFIVLGNERANRFWAARLPPSEALHPDATAEQRREFITNKYRHGCFRLPHPQHSSQESLLQALNAAVSGPSLLRATLQFFAVPLDEEAGDGRGPPKTRPWCTHGDGDGDGPPGNDTGGLGEEAAGLESVYNEIVQPVSSCGYLHRAPVVVKAPTPRKSREEWQRVWCSLEKSLLFYEADRGPEPLARIDASEVVSLGVSRAEAPAGPAPSDRFRFTLELFLGGERIQQLGADGPDSLQAWASALGKWLTPLSCHCLLGYEFQKVGRLHYKSLLNPDRWLEGYFLLQKAHLFICPGEEGAAEDSINLRQLQELSVVPLAEGPEKRDMLVLVEMGRTFCLRGACRLDFSSWCAAIRASAGGQGNALRDQQLSRSGIPILVNSCVAFITQHGLQHEGIYRKNGAKSRIKELMDEFRRDARNVKLRISDHFVEDVTDVLKRFFRELEDPVFTTYLHPRWKEAAEIVPKAQRLECYRELLGLLPHLNRRTLAALIGHLYRVQKCAGLNQMNTKNLALLFAPSLFQTDGKGEHEVRVMEDLIDSYVHIFNIDEDQVSQMDLENSLITTWRDVQLSQAGDIILEVYLERKTPDSCVTLKVSPVLRAEELANRVLEMRGVAASLEMWMTFEVLENGELERPLHPKEKVLEQALQWCKLPQPGSAYLLVRRVPIQDASCLFTGAKRESPKCGLLRCREDPPRLLGSKFQERYFVIKDHKLLLLKEKRSAKPEREWPLDMAKVYMGIRKKLKPPSQWGFTLCLEKQQLYLACSGQAELWDWTTSILKAQHDGLRPIILRRRSSSDLARQKFGTMPLIPLRGDGTDPIMLSANQTLRRLHTRRTLSMFFPTKAPQDAVGEQQEATESEPVYEEVGGFSDMDLPELGPSLLPPVDRAKKPTPLPEQGPPSPPPPCPAPRPPGAGPMRACHPEHASAGSPSGQGVASRASPERPTQPGPSQAWHPPPATPTDPAERPPGTERPVQDSRKRSLQAERPVSSKLVQELSTAVLRKSERQSPGAPGEQTPPPEDGPQAPRPRDWPL
ncbi:arf-GAP with Rho-GAP domain, ANK repeat and PH domain-containing protein 3 [Varanus komodoensis]|uniref:arf-GAP with Rho-GAP domain, ANK repeat and PH domain-containing protein 3 n=1 Tax=Varanus komodoensis TaxID=61221 RepID=UPI001CF78BB3|nr:arf-GAP with Rho-GAP domain, ANK repeat and PH domain-containing protein 3 [Varanus komodoensis]